VALLVVCAAGALGALVGLMIEILSRQNSVRRLGEIRAAVRARPRQRRMKTHITETVAVPITVEEHEPITGAIDLPPEIKEEHGQIRPPEEYQDGAQL